jgi:hypothetical protein
MDLSHEDQLDLLEDLCSTKKNIQNESDDLFHTIVNFCVIFLILQHIKQNHNHITSYKSAHTIEGKSPCGQVDLLKELDS